MKLNKLHIPIGIIIVLYLLFTACTPTTHLHKGWYTYKQIKNAGYYCTPFKGRHYIRPTQDSLKVNIIKL